jgi:protein involved in polysaccharide export with SLBB domain
MFRRLFLAVLLLLSSLFSAQLQAQIDPIGRPRRTQTAPAPVEPTSRETQSESADAEAKRLYKIGVRYGSAGLYEQAAEMFERVVKLKPDYGDAHLSLGHAYYDLRLWEQAVDSLQRGLTLKPGDKDSRRRLADAQRMLDQQTVTQQKTRPVANDAANNAIGARMSSAAYRTVDATAKPAVVDDALTKIYRVGPGDVLNVRLTDAVPAQPTLFTVTAAGFLEHAELSAPILTAGFTVEEIAARIEDDLKQQSSIKNPRVSVAVEEYISHTILVSGLVKEPGTKSLKREGIPLFVVIADAQPLPEAGRVNVQRNASNEAFMIDLLETSALNMLVRPGDVVSLLEREAQFFYLSGRVNSPGEKVFRRGLTLTQAIIVAGGLSKDGKKAELARDNGKGFLVVTRYKLKEIDSGKVPDPPIKPGDRITISN